MLKLMVHMQTITYRLRNHEGGQTFVEYALLIGGVSIILLAAFSPLKGAIEGLVTDIKNKIDAT
jgi:Flp pilus assembly pilin Flp